MPFWVYENTIHKYASLHDGDCSFCGDGRGLRGEGKTPSGMWHGPFADIESGKAAATRTGQLDLRSCTLCVGGEVVFGSERVLRKPSNGPIKADWDKSRELNCSLRLLWNPKGLLSLDEKERVTFPSADVEPGLYKFSARHPDGRLANYIGESDNLSRRFGNYRSPGPSQPTNLRINFWIKELLHGGGEISIATAQVALLNDVSADLSRKPVRRMFEQMAIALEHAEDIESLNR